MRTTAKLLLAIVLFISCNNVDNKQPNKQYHKTSTGLLYIITNGGSNEKLKQGQYVKFNIEYKVPPKDSILTNSFGHVPAYMIVDTTRPSRHSFLEIITQCAAGDKVEFVMSVDTLVKLGMIKYNNIFHPGDMIKGRVEIIKVFTNQNDATVDLQKEQDLEKIRGVNRLQANDPLNSVETTKSCLIDYDWMYPSENNPTSAWKFLRDGTFNYSTTMFGGMSAWGNWHIDSPGRIRVSYTKTTEGRIPDDKILTMPSCSSLEVGSTTYVKK